MTDVALTNATQRRDDLAAKINAALQQVDEWKRELARADAFIADWHAFAMGTPEAPISAEAAPTARRRNRTNSKKEEVAEAAHQIISERGEPVVRSDLFKALIERGFTIEGTDPEMVLSTMLWRMREAAGIIRLTGDKGGYWLREKEYEPAQYYPYLEHLMGVSDDGPPSDMSETDAE